MMKPSKALGIAAIVSIAVVFLFLTSAAAPAMSSNQANAFTSSQQQNLLPNPVLNSNITWSTHYSKWGVLEYSNGTGNKTLNAHLNSQYANPISINPLDIVSNALIGKSWAGQNWLNTANWTANTDYGSVITTSQPTANQIEITMNGSKAGTMGATIHGQSALISQLPTSNPAYLYETVIGYSTSTVKMTGANMHLTVTGNDGEYYQVAVNGTQVMNQSKEGTLGTINIPIGSPFIFSFPLSDFTKSINALSSIGIIMGVSIPTQTVSNNYIYLHITGISLTTHIISLGTNNNEQVEGSFGNVELNTLNPTFQYSSIVNGGYSVAVSQSIENLTTQQNAISSGNYIEQVEYQGSFGLPTAPDLSYSASSVSEKFNVSSSQTQVLDINGLSYLSVISGKNGTVTLLSGVNPNSQTQFLQIVDYTQTQWNSISSPPGIFSIAGIEYYWWIAVGGLATLIGLAAAAKHAGTKADQERIRRGGGR